MERRSSSVLLLLLLLEFLAFVRKGPWSKSLAVCVMRSRVPRRRSNAELSAAGHLSWGR